MMLARFVTALASAFLAALAFFPALRLEDKKRAAVLTVLVALIAYEYVFKPAGGLRSPLRATLVTFLVSGLVHEYVFGIASGRVQGYQILFFLAQGLGVIATLRLRPAGWSRWPCLGATWIFNLATSVLFFASVNSLAPFYACGLPTWLIW